MQGDNWTPTALDTLRDLWAQGISTSKIARALGCGFTKNSVIGKAHRLGLSERPKTVTGNPYSPEEDEIIVQSVEADLDDDQIALLLDGRTRHAVQTRRYKLEILLTPETRARQKLVGQRAQKAKLIRQRRQAPIASPKRAYRKSQPILYVAQGTDDFGWNTSGPKAPILPVSISRRDLQCETVRNEDREPDGCRWIIGDCRPWMVCAAKRVRGESYCEEHSARAFRPFVAKQQMENAA